MESSLKTRVFFSAVRKATSEGDTNNVQPGEVVTFTHNEVNIGSGMNPDTGIFTVPLSGIYSFSFSANCYKTSDYDDAATYIEVHKNDEKQFLIMEDLRTNTYSLLGYSWTMYLAQNDKIHLYTAYNGLFVNRYINVRFNGQLLMAQ